MEFFQTRKRSKCMTRAKCNLMETKALEWVAWVMLVTYLECFSEVGWEDFHRWEVWVAWGEWEGEAASRTHSGLAEWGCFVTQ